MKYRLLHLLLLYLAFSSCKAVKEDIKVLQHRFTYPILKSKPYNHVLLLEIQDRDSLTPTHLSGISIDLSGETIPDDIESITVYAVEGRDKFITPDSPVFATSGKIAPVVNLKGNMLLKKAENFFWVSVKLKNKADISHTMTITCNMVKTDSTEIRPQPVPSEETKKLNLGVAVRKHGDNGVHTYRIPSLITTNTGTLIAGYDMRYENSRDLQGNIDIGISRSTDGGNTWGDHRVVLDRDTWGGLPEKFNGVSDASLLVDKNTGQIFVAGLWMHGVLNKNGAWITGLTETSDSWNHQWKNKGSQPGFGVKETSQFLLSSSTDDGLTWKAPVNLTQMCKKEDWWLWAPAPGNGITMRDGTLVFPTQGRDANGLPFSNITYSTDGGKHWQTSNPANHNTTECAVVQLSDGTLMLNMRDNRNRKEKGKANGRAVAITQDMGTTWTTHSSSHGALIEPVCMGSLYKHEYMDKGEKKSILFFSNPNSREKRNNMTIKASLDNGKTWPEKYWILLDEGSGRGYSSLASVDKNTIGILYEGSQADMTFQTVDITSIMNDVK